MGWKHATDARRRRPHRPTILLENLELRQLLSIAAVNNASLDSSTGAAAVRAQYDVDGAGLTAAVIDTGIDYHNANLGGKFGDGGVVTAGWDFGDNDADPDASTWQHGTSVAGLIASRNPNASGVAPGANLAALKVFDSSNRSSFTKIADALQWVLDNHEKYNITVVNLSLSDNNNYVRDWFTDNGGVEDRISSLVKQLRDAKIPVVAASGNSFSGYQGMGFTAIIPDTLSVTALDSSNQSLLASAQRLGSDLGGKSATDLAAPGQGLRTLDGSSGTATVEGTSFSAPVVSGAVLLLQQIYQKRFGTLPTVDQIEGWLKQGSTQVRDSVTGISVNRLDIAKAASLIPNPNPTPTTPVTPVKPTPTPPVVVPPTTPPVVTNPNPTTPTTPTTPEPPKQPDPVTETPPAQPSDDPPTSTPTDNGGTSGNGSSGNGSTGNKPSKPGDALLAILKDRLRLNTLRIQGVWRAR